MLAQKTLRVARCSCGVLRSTRAFSTETPSSESSSESSTSAPSNATAPRGGSALELESLWERVIRTPGTALNGGPGVLAPAYERPSRGGQQADAREEQQREEQGRAREGKQGRARGHGHAQADRRPARTFERDQGPTHAEKARFNDSLRRIFQDLERNHFGPSRVTTSWEAMTRMPAVQLRREDDSRELNAAIDALGEDLAAQRTPADALAWAEDNVFRPEGGEDGAPAAAPLGGQAAGQTWPKTYPKALGALISHLRTLDAPHLALAMFEHARNLGVESYIAGCQTSAYNELIRVRWECFRDLKGVHTAVKEMEGAAVGWDRFTNRIVEDVVRHVGAEMLEKPDAWGPDAYEMLASLEKSIALDHNIEQKVFERGTFFRKAEKGRFYREREREMARVPRERETGRGPQAPFGLRKGAFKGEGRRDRSDEGHHDRFDNEGHHDRFDDEGHHDRFEREPSDEFSFARAAQRGREHHDLY